MKIVLREDGKGLGERGKVVDVSDGYARNYIIPNKLAYTATETCLNKLKEEDKIKKLKEGKILKSSQEIARHMEKISCTINVKVGEEDKMYGSVTSSDIVDSLSKEGIKVDKKDVMLEKPIKELGVFSIDIRIHPEVTGKVKVWVVKE